MKSSNQSQSTSQSSPTECYLLPDGFLRRFEILEQAASDGFPGAVYLFEKLRKYCWDSDLVSAAHLLKCGDLPAVDPLEDFSDMARSRLMMLPENIRTQVLNACQLGDFAYVRSVLRVIDLEK